MKKATEHMCDPHSQLHGYPLLRGSSSRTDHRWSKRSTYDVQLAPSPFPRKPMSDRTCLVGDTSSVNAPLVFEASFSLCTYQGAHDLINNGHARANLSWPTAECRENSHRAEKRAPGEMRNKRLPFLPHVEMQPLSTCSRANQR